jgi:mannose-6-phosphate isomerase-like protein (cupin superfamily)
MAQQTVRRPQVPEGFERCFYTLWGREGEEERIWEIVPSKDLVGSLVEGTGRQDWRKLRPFDLLPEIDPAKGGMERLLLYAGETLRVGCDHIVGAQPMFERAGDFDTIMFQFAGCGLVETSFGRYELNPGEALHIPAMVAHRTIGSPNCRRMLYYPRDRATPKLDPAAETTDIRYVNLADGNSPGDRMPEPVRPPDGQIHERLSQWDERPGESYVFLRTYDYMVGRAESGPRPTKLRPYNYFPTPPDSPKAAVRTALLWESPTFRQRVYANPGRQPAPHRGYDEDEFWFQFSGRVDQETEHAAYPIEGGETSMAEPGISHTSFNHPGSLRLTTYTNKPLRLVVDPNTHLRESCWRLEETMVRGWRTED